VSEAEGRAVSRCLDCHHEQELHWSWCQLCGNVRLEIVLADSGYPNVSAADDPHGVE
jgi:hypothetical protein